jgi:hypothetical protein
MHTAIGVLVPVPRWAEGRWRSTTLPVRTRDLRVVFLMIGLGVVVWVAAILLLVALVL